MLFSDATWSLDQNDFRELSRAPTRTHLVATGALHVHEKRVRMLHEAFQLAAFPFLHRVGMEEVSSQRHLDLLSVLSQSSNVKSEQGNRLEKT
jgi:hypothetical protein